MTDLILPTNNMKLYNGDIVTIEGFSNLKWIVRYGYYQIDNTLNMDWYFYCIQDGNLLPATSEILENVTVISQVCHPGVPYPPSYPSQVLPLDSLDKPAMFTKSLNYELDRSFISVDTIADRNSLLCNGRKLPNGKLVRVNNVEGTGVQYYRWDSYENTWINEPILIDASKYYTIDEVTAKIEAAKLYWDNF